MAQIPATPAISVAPQKSGSGGTILAILGGVVVIGGGIAGYFLFLHKDANGQTYMQKRKSESDAKKLNVELAKEKEAKDTGKPYVAPPTPSGFPIKSGNRGALVSRLQTALKNVWKQPLQGANGGVDGNFGGSTLTALRAIGYPDVIDDEATLQAIEKHAAKQTADTTTTKGAGAGKTIDSFGGTYVKALYETPVYYINDSSLFKRYKAGEGIGRLGDSIGGGYHKLYEVVDDNSVFGVKIADSLLRQIFKI